MASELLVATSAIEMSLDLTPTFIRELHRLLTPFGCPTKVYDPWLPGLLIERAGARPAPLEDVLASSRIVFVFAAVTTENEGLLGREELERVRPGAALILMSRAGVVDFAALTDLVAAGRLRAATDVFPDEPVAPDDPVRRLDGLLLSPHLRAACARRSCASASWRSPTSRSSSAASRPSPASAPSGRRPAACAAGL